MELIWTLLRVAAILVAVWVIYLIAKNSLFVVQQGTVTVVKRWGKHHRVLSAGLHFRMLFADSPHRTFSAQRTSLSLELRGDSGGQLPVCVSAELELCGLTNHTVVERLAYDVEQPLAHLKVVATATVRELLLPMSFEQLLADSAIAHAIKAQLQGVAGQCGFEILAVRITSIRPHDSVQQVIVDSVRAETLRATEAAQATHDAELRLSAAKTAAEVGEIEAKAERARMDEEAKQVIDLIGKLVQAGVKQEQISQIVSTLLNKAAIDALGANPNAKVVLLPPSIQLAGNTDSLMQLAQQD